MQLTYASSLRRILYIPVVLSVSALALTGCSSSSPAQSGSQSDKAASQSEGDHPKATGSATEVSAPATRMAMSYDGGIVVMDADTLKVIEDIKTDGFTRVADAGDGRHVAVTTEDQVRLLDVGTWVQAHGEHGHAFIDTPKFTDVSHAATKPGHVVAHGGHTVLFDDGTGKAQIFESAEMSDGAAAVMEYQSEAVHHGVAVMMNDGTLLVTKGTEESRDGLLAQVPDGKVIAQTDQCEGIHGEAVAAGEVAVFGCKDGTIIYKGGAIEKLQSPDKGTAISSLVAAPDSSVILGDYKAVDDSETAPTRVSLIDTDKETINAVDLGTTYSFRSLARGDDSEALILGTDGSLHVLDPTTGKETIAVSVIPEWKIPEDWREPRPLVVASGGNAYVIDPVNKMIYAVDVHTGEVWNKAELTQPVGEVAVVTGFPSSKEGDSEDHHDHDHHDAHDHAE